MDPGARAIICCCRTCALTTLMVGAPSSGGPQQLEEAVGDAPHDERLALEAERERGHLAAQLADDRLARHELRERHPVRGRDLVREDERRPLVEGGDERCDADGRDAAAAAGV